MITQGDGGRIVNVASGAARQGGPSISAYSASKAGADRLAYSYFATYDLPVVITRASNNYGPYQFPEKVIPLFVTNLLDGLRVPLYGDGLNVRDWLHVDDHCRGVQLVVGRQAGEPSGGGGARVGAWGGASCGGGVGERGRGGDLGSP